MRKVLLFVLPLFILIPIAMLMGCSAAPTIDLPTPVSTIGQATPVTVHASGPSGIRSASATIEQNGASYSVWQMAQPSKAKESTWNFTAGVKTTPQLKDGKAKLIVEATSNGMMHKSVRIERDVTVVTQPPTVSVDSEQHYLYIGMADTGDLQRVRRLHVGRDSRRRPVVSRMADAGRKTGCVFAVRLCMEHAGRAQFRWSLLPTARATMSPAPSP